jgi:hypothetical protein
VSNAARRRQCFQRSEPHMLDILMLTIGLALFALSVGYAYGCERL